jgi:hypothetical protein
VKQQHVLHDAHAAPLAEIKTKEDEMLKTKERQWLFGVAAHIASREGA